MRYISLRECLVAVGLFLAFLGIVFLSGCAAPASYEFIPAYQTPYERQKEDYNAKVRGEKFCAGLGKEYDYERRACK